MSSSLPSEVSRGEGCGTPTLGVRRSYYKKEFWNQLIIQKAILDKLEEIRFNNDAANTITNNILSSSLVNLVAITNILSAQLGSAVTTPTVRTELDTIADRLIAANSSGSQFSVATHCATIADSNRNTAIAGLTTYKRLDNIYLELSSNTNSLLNHIITNTEALETVPLPVVVIP